MTLVSKPGEKSTHVFDLTYSRGHEERQIVSVDDNGLALTYEASSVSFLSTVNTETEYAPALTVIPTLHTGAKRRGTSTAYNSDRSVSRVIDWNASVVGREVVRIADEDVEAWVVKVTRRSRLGTRDQEARTRIFWYDPARAIWVKWTESVKMSRRYRFGTYQYDSKLTATLQSFRH
jgi:hypothetical protein